MGFKNEDQFQKESAKLIRKLGWLAWHTPNERKNEKERVKLAALGVLTGVSDWFIAEPWEEGWGICIELKMPSNGPTAAQDRFLEQAKARGCLTAVCRSWDEFREVLRKVRPANGRRMP